MYAICSTAKEDVAKCVQEMAKQGLKLPIVQFGAAKYKALEADHSKIMEACKKVAEESIYAINLTTRKIHKDTCRCKGKNVVGARLARLDTTGLINCMNCMR